ncbi:MAG TPA: PEP-CTERM sorting domain-containing protein [Fimbriimonadaceae bacterium]|nr:PEP-CTERM sorting domain-containing protein [Fimbriimonadaceae bacterium]
MRTRAFRTLTLVSSCCLSAAFASAQSYNSFNLTDGIYGIGVNQNNLSYTVSMSPGAYLMLGGSHYDITDVFGFWSLSGANPLNASGADQIQWNWNSHSTGGYIAGWNNNSKSNDIQPGGQLTFTYDALTQANVEGYGFHFSLAQNFNGSNTAYFRGPLNPVPEPAGLAAVGLGLAALLRRRRKASA